MSVTYDTLVVDVPRILMAENSRLVDDMDLIIRQAHELIFGVVDHDLYRATLPAIPLDPLGEIDLSTEDPPVFEIRALRLTRPGENQAIPLRRREVEWLTQVYHQGLLGEPLYYCEDGGLLQLRVYPVPDVTGYQVTPVVNQHPVVLGSDDGAGGKVQTNVLTERASRALEKACLYQGALYMKNPADIETYKREFNEAVVQVNAQIKRRRRDDTGEQPRDATNTGAA